MNVLIFFIGLLAGAVGAFVLISATYGTDGEDYYGRDKNE